MTETIIYDNLSFSGNPENLNKSIPDKDKRQEAIERLKKRVLSGKRISEEEVADALYYARDQALLAIALNVADGNFEDMTSIETRTPGGKTVYKRKDIMRLFNVLQNACERHDRFNSPGEENPLDALAQAWQDAIDRTCGAS